MDEPTDVDQYNRRLRDNIKTVGNGPQTVLHQPCPFCAAPDFMVHSLAATMATWLLGSHCAECGRGAKGVFTPAPGGVSMEIVQTSGREPPVWLQPRMRKVWEVGRE
jgi:hypothetical protein